MARVQSTKHKNNQPHVMKATNWADGVRGKYKSGERGWGSTCQSSAQMQKRGAGQLSSHVTLPCFVITSHKRSK
jgi:hypothetical protein